MKISGNIDKSEFTTAFKAQDATMCATNYIQKAIEKDAVDTAIEAKVKRLILSDYGLNNTNPAARALSAVFYIKVQQIEYLKSREICCRVRKQSCPLGDMLTMALGSEEGGIAAASASRHHRT